MERVDRCRQAARDIVADVEPPRLQAIITTLLEDASMTPGLLTLESAAAATDSSPIDDNQLARYAAGVQLTYEGLRLTRRLIHEEPWSRTQPADATEGDLEILAADILVARGFYLLAHTDAAERAVDIVRAFGRDQTRRDGVDDTADLDANLERDIIELATLVGAEVVGATPTARLHAITTALSELVHPNFANLPTEGLQALLANVDAEDVAHELERDVAVASDRATSATDH